MEQRWAWVENIRTLAGVPHNASWPARQVLQFVREETIAYRTMEQEVNVLKAPASASCEAAIDRGFEYLSDCLE